MQLFWLVISIGRVQRFRLKGLKRLHLLHVGLRKEAFCVSLHIPPVSLSLQRKGQLCAVVLCYMYDYYKDCWLLRGHLRSAGDQVLPVLYLIKLKLFVLAG